MNNTSPEKKTDFKKKLLGTEGIIAGCVIFGLIFLVVIIVQSCTPRKGGVIYGMCGAFLEQQVTFPETISHTSVEQYPRAVRIYFTHIDGFGQYQFEMVECAFIQDAQKGIQLERAFFNYIKSITETERVAGKGRLYEVKQEHIELFNRSGSPETIRAYKPDVSLPTTNRRF